MHREEEQHQYIYPKYLYSYNCFQDVYNTHIFIVSQEGTRWNVNSSLKQNKTLWGSFLHPIVAEYAPPSL